MEASEFVHGLSAYRTQHGGFCHKKLFATFIY
jgi:hypothetical protein